MLYVRMRNSTASLDFKDNYIQIMEIKNNKIGFLAFVFSIAAFYCAAYSAYAYKMNDGFVETPHIVFQVTSVFANTEAQNMPEIRAGGFSFTDAEKRKLFNGISIIFVIAASIFGLVSKAIKQHSLYYSGGFLAAFASLSIFNGIAALIYSIAVFGYVVYFSAKK